MRLTMLKKAAAALLAAALTAALTACSGSTAGTTAAKNETTAAENKPLREMNVVLDWYPNALHTFIYTAIERGYYEEEGLDVHVQFPANDNDALALVAAGKAEIGLYYEHDVIQAVANQDCKIKSIGAVVQCPLNIILSLKEKNITSPKDFAGKTIGYGGTVLSEALIYTMMDESGVDRDSVELVNVGFELMSSMTTGNVDATIGCLVNHEVPQMEEEGFELNYFPVSGYGIPNYYEGVFLANNEMIENEPEALAGFLRASKRAYEDFKADPDACLEILLNNQNEENFPLSPTVEKQSCEVLLDRMEMDGCPFLSQTEEHWQENIDWMYEKGLITEKVTPQDVMTVIEY